MATATLKVAGMSCEHCVKAVTNALTGADGVKHVQVDLKAGRAVVDYDDAKTTPRELANAIMDEGYSAEEVASSS